MHGHERQHDVDVGEGGAPDLMSLEIIRRSAASAVGIIADRRLYLTADRAHVVEEGAPDAAYLFATPGYVIPAAEADRLGLVLVDGMVKVAASAPAPAETPQDPPPPPATEPPAETDEKAGGAKSAKNKGRGS